MYPRVNLDFVWQYLLQNVKKVPKFVKTLINKFQPKWAFVTVNDLTNSKLKGK